jgi:DNA-binding NarL/FixJ family response regulator
MSDLSAVRVFLFDEHDVARRGLLSTLETTPGFDVVGEAASIEQARIDIPRIAPDVAILTTGQSQRESIELCREVRAASPDTYCLILTGDHSDVARLDAVGAGASGYLDKTARATELVDAARHAAAGLTVIPPNVIAEAVQRARDASDRVSDEARLARLTERERVILDMIALGATNRQIAEELTISEKTVKTHVGSLLSKLELTGRAQAAVLATRTSRPD